MGRPFRIHRHGAFIHFFCENLIVRNTTVKNPWYSQNGDGIDIESCKNSIVHDSNFDVGDDAICIKSGKDKEGLRDRGIPNENLIVKNCIVFHGHGGVTVGSEMSGWSEKPACFQLYFYWYRCWVAFQEQPWQGRSSRKYLYLSN